MKSIKPQDVTGQQTASYGILQNPFRFAIDGKSFDPARPPRQLKLGDVDEWTLTSKNNVGAVAHPFHIHVNPLEVISIKDPTGRETLAEPVWRDTIIIRGNWTVKFRTRYSRFTGKFVQHCHILDHEDQGMMEVVEVVP
ncbi:MAG: multicopper oxidase domain-containing protein [Planctomycetota bacterium]|nr:multicopper oxidase domain-containing protein [Planctomycetota bacterium]